GGVVEVEELVRLVAAEERPPVAADIEDARRVAEPGQVTGDLASDVGLAPRGQPHHGEDNGCNVFLMGHAPGKDSRGSWLRPEETFFRLSRRPSSPRSEGPGPA